MYVYKSMVGSRVTNAHHIINSALTGLRSPAGPRRLGTASRMSASLSRRLSAFFGSTSDQDQKAAKFAVLIPGRAGFRTAQNDPRVVIPPPSETPLFRRVSRCVRSCWRRRVVYPLSPAKANVGRFAGHCDKSFFAAWYPLMEVGDGCL